VIARTALAAAVTALLLAPSVGNGAGTASRVVDRTFLCTAAGLGGGLWGFEVLASPPETGQDPQTRLTGFAAHVFTLSPGPPDAQIATVAAGRSPYGIGIGREHCRRSTTQIRLTRRGLDGGRFSPFFTEYDCDTSRSVLIRVRAVFRGRSAFASRGRLLAASGEVRTASLAVATYPKRKPVVLVSVTPQGGRLFLAESRFVKD
jgi:hypothetical protein